MKKLKLGSHVKRDYVLPLRHLREKNMFRLPLLGSMSLGGTAVTIKRLRQENNT